jgi:nucleoside phosphorylase
VARTLIVSAFEPEIAPLRRILRGQRKIVLEPVGIGAIDAAVGAAGAIARVRPERVLFVGTAGIYGRQKGSRQAIGTAVVAREVLCMSTAALKGEAYLPGPMIVQVPTSRSLQTALGSGQAAPPGDVACPLAITRSATLGRRIADATGATLENLEAFAVARASAAAGVAFAAVLGVANRVGPTGHEEWQRHHRAASRAACELIARFLDRDLDLGLGLDRGVDLSSRS